MALVAAALAGCGGDDEPAETSAGDEFPPPLTRAEFIREADRICFATESQIEAAGDDLVIGDTEPTPNQVKRVARDFVVPRLRAQVDTIRLLGIPKSDEAEVERVLELTEQGADEIEADPTGYLSRPPRALIEAQESAEAYGADECGLNLGRLPQAE